MDMDTYGFDKRETNSSLNDSYLRMQCLNMQKED